MCWEFQSPRFFLPEEKIAAVRNGSLSNPIAHWQLDLIGAFRKSPSPFNLFNLFNHLTFLGSASSVRAFLGDLFERERKCLSVGNHDVVADLHFFQVFRVFDLRRESVAARTFDRNRLCRTIDALDRHDGFDPARDSASRRCAFRSPAGTRLHSKRIGLLFGGRFTQFGRDRLVIGRLHHVARLHFVESFDRFARRDCDLIPLGPFNVTSRFSGSTDSTVAVIVVSSDS